MNKNNNKNRNRLFDIIIFLTIISLSTISLALTPTLKHLLNKLISSAQANQNTDFQINIERRFIVRENTDTLLVREKRLVKNNSSIYYIPSNTKETFTIQNFKEGFDSLEQEIKTKSINVKNEMGQNIPFEKELLGQDIRITVSYPRDILANSQATFILEYETNELIEKIGLITNIYIPGLEDSYTQITQNEDGSVTQEVLYQTFLEIPSSMEKDSFTVPSPTKTTSQGTSTILEFSTESILGKSVWHQIGSSQIYHFKISLPTVKTDDFTPSQLSFLSKNDYSIILPREYNETNQKVFFSKIEPMPDTIRRDNDGNIIATFSQDANKDSEIVIEGYVTVSVENLGEERNNIPSFVDLSEVSNFSDMQKYLTESQYWEVNHPEIQAKARELAGTSNNLIEILESNYRFIVTSIDYDEFKYGDRNTRQGALATLRGGDSVCMEYSDLLIALLRAQGIPARAAYGYGYDPQFTPDNQESHQWVQAWIPSYGWLTIDPTWGQTGRKFIGKDLDHALWYVASEHPNNPAPLEITSTMTDFNLPQIKFEIIAIDTLPTEDELISISHLQSTIPAERTLIEEISQKVQISPVGKSMVIIAPSCVFVVFIVVFVQAITKLIKAKSTKPEIY